MAPTSLKDQYLSLNVEIDFMLMTEVWLIENFGKDIEDSIFSFFSKPKIAKSVHETSYNDFSFRDIKVL